MCKGLALVVWMWPMRMRPILKFQSKGAWWIVPYC
uniref:Uncharacterized protein n=1 Tax=Arundo donax TaxID=35708 RepID=A0A0A9A428_ARUDO